MGWGLVLAGGGTRGSYHVGVWKAICEMELPICGITGTSIGAVNGALFAQGDTDAVMELWDGIHLGDIVALPEGAAGGENLFDVKNLTAIAKEIYQNNGLDVTPLENILRRAVKEDKLRAAEIDYGLATFSLTEKAEISLFKEDIPEGKLVDYLLASACLPGFKPKKIDNTLFLDGGILNNMPVNMLIDKDYTDIITVDLKGVGVVKSVNTAGRNIIPIRCGEGLGGTMEFTPESLKRNISLGYFDTLRALGRAAGERYFFKAVDYTKKKAKYSEEILKGLECAAKIFKIEQFKLYRVEELAKIVLLEYNRFVKKNKFYEFKIKLEDRFLVYYLVNAMINKNYDFLGSKLVAGILGDTYNAAVTIAYFIKKLSIGSVPG